MRIRLLVATTLLTLLTTARADEAAVRRMVETKLGGAGAIEGIQKAPWGDLYEVVIHGVEGARIYYVDSAASVIIAGQAIDAKSGRNLTEERQRKLNAVKWGSLPLQWAISWSRGTGRRKIAILSDPNCPYCKRLETELATLDDLTVYILPYPVISPKSVTQAKAVWCSKDRAKAWNDLMLQRVEPQALPDCETPIEKVVAFGHSIGANSTPTWFIESGERFTGALPLAEVRKLLDGASPQERN